MPQALIRDMTPDLAADYKAAAKANGRSYQAELLATLVRHRPKKKLSPQEWRVEADRLAALSKPGPDSTELIREARNARFVGDGVDVDC